MFSGAFLGGILTLGIPVHLPLVSLFSYPSPRIGFLRRSKFSKCHARPGSSEASNPAQESLPGAQATGSSTKRSQMVPSDHLIPWPLEVAFVALVKPWGSTQVSWDFRALHNYSKCIGFVGRWKPPDVGRQAEYVSDERARSRMEFLGLSWISSLEAE